MEEDTKTNSELRSCLQLLVSGKGNNQFSTLECQWVYQPHSRICPMCKEKEPGKETHCDPETIALFGFVKQSVFPSPAPFNLWL